MHSFIGMGRDVAAEGRPVKRVEPARKLALPAGPGETLHTMTHLEDRRRKRSVDPLVALHYKLAYARKNGALDAIVVADSSGVVVAGAGSWATCEELAAYAPLLARTTGDDYLSLPVASRIETMRSQVGVRTMVIDGQEVLLCARSVAARAADGATRDASLEDAAEGVVRILARAA
jgi:hypothetical protein